MLPNYGPLLQQQPYNTRRGLALGIMTDILTKSTTISAPEDVHNILELCDILLRDQKDAPPTTIPKAPSSHYDPLPKYTRSHLPKYNELDDDNDGTNISEEQGLIAKLIQLFHSDDDDTQFLVSYHLPNLTHQ
jgi:vacuolar protein sorting-associated protein 35